MNFNCVISKELTADVVVIGGVERQRLRDADRKDTFRALTEADLGGLIGKIAPKFLQNGRVDTGGDRLGVRGEERHDDIRF